MSLNFRKLQFKLWQYFVLFTAVILIALWLFQIVFLQSFYEGMKQNEIVKTGNEIIKNMDNDDFQDVMDKISFDNSLRILVFDGQGNVLSVSDEHGGMLNFRSGLFAGRQIIQIPIDYSTLLQRLSDSPAGRVSFSVEDRRLSGKTMIFSARLHDADGDVKVLLVSAPLQPVDSTTSVLMTQLVYVSVLALLLGLLVSFFIARKLSKPISNITSSASRLAKGDYDVVFEKSNYAEIDELAATLNYATRELSKVDGLRRDLIANVSHDLRTPLTVVKAYGEMIRDISGDNPEKREKHAEVIINEADRMSHLVSDILDISKLQTGNAPMTKTSFDLSESVRSIMERFDILSERDGYGFSAELAGDTPVFADKLHIEQVIYNLIGNAVNYTGDDKRVFVAVKKSENAVRFEVKDTGKGIPGDMLESIWDRYYKASETHKRSVVGTGLGLSIVKGILNTHGARFGVDSAVGYGSTFWFELGCDKDGIGMVNQEQIIRRL